MTMVMLFSRIFDRVWMCSHVGRWSLGCWAAVVVIVTGVVRVFVYCAVVVVVVAAALSLYPSSMTMRKDEPP